MGEIKIGRLDSDWEELAPYDLSDISGWDGKTINNLSLNFRQSGNMGDYAVRIGWVKLTE